ncbi:SDR family oxidoreductase [Streptomyces sp. NPDC093252]|uniref:SDR family oxidoreductase n=1 Tax=Streptomyces sp. NPDC093252 TaxID=3154980 RepID=UPI00342EE671
MDLHLAGRTAVVTAASGGIGSAVVRTLLAEGARVLGKGLADELGPRGIRVNTVSPALIRIPLWDEYGPRVSQATGGDIRELMTDLPEKINVTLGRWGTPQEVANLIVFLGSPGRVLRHRQRLRHRRRPPEGSVTPRQPSPTRPPGSPRPSPRAEAGSVLGRRVLATGASGGVGSFAVQPAPAGAHVTVAVGARVRAEGPRVWGAAKVVLGPDALPEAVFGSSATSAEASSPTRSSAQAIGRAARHRRLRGGRRDVCPRTPREPRLRRPIRGRPHRAAPAAGARMTHVRDRLARALATDRTRGRSPPGGADPRQGRTRRPRVPPPGGGDRKHHSTTSPPGRGGLGSDRQFRAKAGGSGRLHRPVQRNPLRDIPRPKPAVMFLHGGR